MIEVSERVTTEEIEKMILLYDKYGNYARVGHEMGRAASTISKYIKLKGTPKTAAQTFRNNVRR